MYACSCNDDAEVADIFERSMRTARKQYRCCECLGAIEPSEQYEQIDMLYDGEWAHHKTCRVCAEIAKTFQSCGRTPGVLWEDIHEANCYADEYGEEVFCICPPQVNVE